MLRGISCLKTQKGTRCLRVVWFKKTHVGLLWEKTVIYPAVGGGHGEGSDRQQIKVEFSARDWASCASRDSACI